MFIKVTYTKNGQYEHCDLGLKNASSPFGVIQVADTGMALLHHSRKEQAVTDGICYKIDI
ncbi:hypothetical protein [Wolbachia endosymbiont of Kerria lacca]|uniref:hypothetical protein n=1 Tax=Wolbachia endosymbiont of Kerria lacca TaxID=427705 RepID=UPI003F667C77